MTWTHTTYVTAAFGAGFLLIGAELALLAARVRRARQHPRR